MAGQRPLQDFSRLMKIISNSNVAPCNSTRYRISRFEVAGLCPRTMPINPANKTPTVANSMIPMAMEAKVCIGR